MPYHLIPGEPVPAGVRRIVCEEMESAARQLSGQGDPGRDAAIHEARKSLKKIRGALRLMRPEIDPVYRLENHWFRDAGLRLSRFRDAGVMIETFDALREKYGAELGRNRLARIRHGLLARKQQAEAQGNIEAVLGRIAASLLRRKRRVGAWPLAATGFAAIAPGLEASFRRGRKALARVRQDPSAANYHEWRKRVKDHWYHVRLLEGLWDSSMHAYEKRLKDLETWLGEDHNLVVLEEQVKADPEFYGSAAQIALLTKLTGKYQNELRELALTAGHHIYGCKPRQFSRRIRHLWDAWQTHEDGRPKAAVLHVAASP